MAIKTEEKKIIYSYRFGVPKSSADNKEKVTEQTGTWPSCLPDGWKTGDAFSGKSTAGPGAWDLEEKKCACGRHLLRSRRTFSLDLFSRPTRYVTDIKVEIAEI